MLDLWGMGGGLVEYRSALFASRGYASLSLAYIGHKELPAPHDRMMVGDSYFKVKYAASCLQKLFFSYFCWFILGQKAFRLLQDHPQVCADKVGMIGLSFGVYLSLRTAAQPDVHVCFNLCLHALFSPHLSRGKHLLSEETFRLAGKRGGEQ